MITLLYQRCPVCRGTFRLDKVIITEGGTLWRCPCDQSETPGWVPVGMTLGQVERAVAAERENEQLHRALQAELLRTADLEAERDKLQAFKSWVHGFLDAHGVPHHPPGPHGAEGCRIGDRMDWLLHRVAELEAERGGLLMRAQAAEELTRQAMARVAELEALVGELRRRWPLVVEELERRAGRDGR